MLLSRLVGTDGKWQLRRVLKDFYLLTNPAKETMNAKTSWQAYGHHRIRTIGP